MSKHTPGPWELRFERSSCAGVNITFNIRSESHVGLASGQSQEHLGENIGICEDECRANARLIAAAPELLQALKQLHKAGGIWPDLLPMVEAALHKATGEQP